MKKYFLHELKTRVPVIGVLAVAALALYLIPIASASYSTSIPAPLWIISTIGGVLAAGVPVWLLSYKMKRRSVDLFYALPLSRIKILAVRLLIGLIAVFAPYTISYWLGAALSFARFSEKLYGIVFLYQYLASLVPILIIYLLSAFVFTRANSFFDGLVFMAFWAFIAMTVGLVVDEMHFLYFQFEVNGFALAPFSPLDRITALFQQAIYVPPYLHCDYKSLSLATVIPEPEVGGVRWDFDFWETAGLILNTLLAAGAGVGLFLTETKSKAEKVGQISDSLYGYKTMLPAYTALIISALDFFVSIFYAIAIVFLVGMFALTAIYRRSIKIGKLQTLIFASSIVLGIVIGFIFHEF